MDIAVTWGRAAALPEIVTCGSWRCRADAAAADHRGRPAPGVQDDPGRHQQEQQVVVPAGPGGERGQRAGVVGPAVREDAGGLHQLRAARLGHRAAAGIALCAARPECKGIGDTLHLWNLRGHNADLTLLRPKLEEQLARHQFGLIILDPAYKVLGDRDENANGEIAGLMNELEALAQRTGRGDRDRAPLRQGRQHRQERHRPDERGRRLGAGPGLASWC